MRCAGLLTVVAMMSCGGKKEVEHSVSMAKWSGRVEVLSVSPSTLTMKVSGVVEAKTRSVIAAQVMGMVKQVPVEVGQSVKAGQLLVALDLQQLAAGAAQAEAGRLEARSALVEAAAAIDAAETQLGLARSSRARLMGLFERKSLTQQEMDEADARLRQAEAGLAMAKAKRGQVEARIAQADQSVAAAATQKGYATLVAPFAGVVTEKLTQVGSMAVPGVPLLSLESGGGYRVALVVDEKFASAVRIGLPLKVSVEGRQPVEVKVSEIVPTLDASTRSLTMKANLPSIEGVRNGAFASGEWNGGQKEMLSVAESAIRESGQLQMVFVLDGSKARSRMVSLGEARQGRREVLNGLKAGEKVLLDVTDALVDGAEVEVKQ